MAEFTTKKFLDESGLKKFWELNKQYIEENLDWININNKPTLGGLTGTAQSAGAHKHDASFSDSTGHTHNVSTVADPNNTASVSTAAHTHNGTAENAKVSGNVTLTGSLSNGVLTITASFSDSTGHTHNVSTVADPNNTASVSTAAHTHNGTAENAKVSGNVTTKSSGAHTHNVSNNDIVL